MTAVTYANRLMHYDDDEGMALLREIARRHGLSLAAALRMIVREAAERRGIRKKTE